METEKPQIAATLINRRKSTLSVRDPGIERLIANLSIDTPSGRDAMRKLAIAITRMVSEWQIARAKARDLAKRSIRYG